MTAKANSSLDTAFVLRLHGLAPIRNQIEIRLSGILMREMRGVLKNNQFVCWNIFR